MPKADISEALERALTAALDHAHAVQRGSSGPREFAAYAAGFKAGWKARSQNRKPTQTRKDDTK
jgi:hypothetical protein